MRELKDFECAYISGTGVRRSDMARARQCAADIETSGERGAKFGGRIGSKMGEWLGELIGMREGIKNSKACQDQIRLDRQRENIERARNGDVSREREFRKR